MRELNHPTWRSPYRPSERWLHNNGFPAFVEHYARPNHWARRGVQIALGTLVWWAILFSMGATTLILIAFEDYDAKLATGEIIENTDETNLDALFNEPAAQDIFTWLGPVTLAIALALAIFAVGRMLMFSVRWFAVIAYRQHGRMLAILPLLLVAVLFFFLAAETWQSVGRLKGFNLTVTLLIFVALTLGFVIRRSQLEAGALESFADTEALQRCLPPIREFRRSFWTRLGLNTRRAARGSRLTPSSPRVYQYEHCTDVMLQRHSLTWLERFNLRVVAVMGRALVALLVAVVVTLFFMLFGFAAVNQQTAAAWMGSPPSPIYRVVIDGSTFVLLAEGIRVSAFLGIFSALYFVVSSGADKDFSEALEEETESHLRTALALRAYTRGL